MMERAIMITRPAHVVRVIAALAVLITVTACGSLTTPKAAAEVHITSPAPNAEVTVGVSTFIKADVTGDSITRVDVQIDGQPYAVLTTDDKTKGMPTFPVSVPWAANSEGIHIIQLIVYGLDAKVLTKSDPLIFKATGGGAAGVKPTATSEPTTQAMTSTTISTAVVVVTNVVPLTNVVAVAATLPPTKPPATATPVVIVMVITVTATSAAPAMTGPGLTVTSDSANVRSGPGTIYAVIGQLPNGSSVAITGKSADGQWWQITFPGAASGLGWLRTDLAQPNDAAAGVAVVAAPPTPSVPTWTSTPSQPTATATPAERACNSSMAEWRGTSDPRYPFCVAQVVKWYDNQDGAHRYENGHDVPVSLSWNIWGVDGIWILFEQDNSGYCGYVKQSAKTINEQVNTGYYGFNVKDFPGGATMRIHLNIKRKDGQVVEFGDMRLCIF
jgi:uncharacterized protein YraI